MGCEAKCGPGAHLVAYWRLQDGASAESLKGYDHQRVTAGEYRVVFDVRDGVLHVITIGKRNHGEVHRWLT